MSKPRWQWLTDFTFKRREEGSPELPRGAWTRLERQQVGACICIISVRVDTFLDERADYATCHQTMTTS